MSDQAPTPPEELACNNPRQLDTCDKVAIQRFDTIPLCAVCRTVQVIDDVFGRQVEVLS